MLSIGNAPAELRAAAAALRVVEPTLRRELNARARTEMNPVWQAEIRSRLRSPIDRAVIGAGVRIKAGNPPEALAAQSRRRLSGGLDPSTDWAPIEFGGNRGKRTTYRRKSPTGGTHEVTRRTARQLPARDNGGRIAFPALKEVAPRLASLWAATIVRTVYEAADRGR